MRWILLSLGLLSGCAAREERLNHRLEGRYRLGTAPEGWAPVDPGGADMAWFNKSLKATIYADSNCGTRYEDRPLWGLADSLMRGLMQPTTLHEEPLVLSGREALLRVSEGQLDGVPVQVAVVVLKKDACNYDLVMITPRRQAEEALPDFKAIVEGFQTTGAR